MKYTMKGDQYQFKKNALNQTNSINRIDSMIRQLVGFSDFISIKKENLL